MAIHSWAFKHSRSLGGRSFFRRHRSPVFVVAFPVPLRRRDCRTAQKRELEIKLVDASLVLERSG
jgi:hypothetical protein